MKDVQFSLSDNIMNRIPEDIKNDFETICIELSQLNMTWHCYKHLFTSFREENTTYEKDDRESFKNVYHLRSNCCPQFFSVLPPILMRNIVVIIYALIRGDKRKSITIQNLIKENKTLKDLFNQLEKETKPILKVRNKGVAHFDKKYYGNITGRSNEFDLLLRGVIKKINDFVDTFLSQQSDKNIRLFSVFPTNFCGCEELISLLKGVKKTNEEDGYRCKTD